MSARSSGSPPSIDTIIAPPSASLAEIVSKSATVISSCARARAAPRTSRSRTSGCSGSRPARCSGSGRLRDEALEQAGAAPRVVRRAATPTAAAVFTREASPRAGRDALRPQHASRRCRAGARPRRRSAGRVLGQRLRAARARSGRSSASRDDQRRLGPDRPSGACVADLGDHPALASARPRPTGRSTIAASSPPGARARRPTAGRGRGRRAPSDAPTAARAAAVPGARPARRRAPASRSRSRISSVASAGRAGERPAAEGGAVRVVASEAAVGALPELGARERSALTGTRPPDSALGQHQHVGLDALAARRRTSRPVRPRPVCTSSSTSSVP